MRFIRACVWVIFVWIAVVFATMVLGCLHLSHTKPEHRTPTASAASVVRIDYSCATESAVWGLGHATGVVINDRTVLTAAHVVRCPGIPVVTVTTYDGRRFSMVVERDEQMFGDGRDIARLVMASGSVLGLRIGPPVLAAVAARDGVYVFTLHGDLRGVARDDLGNADLQDFGYAGDSGAPVFRSDGALLGVVSTGGDPVKAKNIRFEPVLAKDLP